MCGNRCYEILIHGPIIKYFIWITIIYRNIASTPVYFYLSLYIVLNTLIIYWTQKISKHISCIFITYWASYFLEQSNNYKQVKIRHRKIYMKDPKENRCKEIFLFYYTYEITFSWVSFKKGDFFMYSISNP